MRYVLVLLVMVLQASTATAQRVSPKQVFGEARPKLQQAILSHPEPLVRVQLFAWLSDGRVKFAANNIFSEMSVSQEKVGGKNQVLLWYNVEFVLQGMPGMPSADKDDYLKLILYHEAAHLEDHFNGKRTIGPLVEVGPVSNEWLAQDTWDGEWNAVNKEWVLANKMGKPYLVSEIALATRNGYTPRAFLEGFYHLQMSGTAVKAYPSFAAGFTAIYQRELAKLVAHQR